MKLRNKDDGRVKEFGIDETKSFPYYLRDEFGNTYWAKTLKEIADKWEDYEEPKGIIDICLNTGFSGFWRVQIDYNDREEAEKAVEKLKAWERLKDRGFKFNGLSTTVFDAPGIEYDIDEEAVRFLNSEANKDLNLLFGGKDD